MSRLQPKYPIYIISKGRADTRMTVKTLEKLGTPYRIVIEESEYADYSAVSDPKNILTLPEGFRDNPRWAKRCEATGLLGGSIPARNWVWEHSIAEGHKRHWILDDNIQHMFRLNKNKKIRCESGVCFRAAEDFSDRYKDLKMSGLNYAYFAPAATKRPPYYHNTRVYSCILLSNDIYPEFAWRGSYNEDTDLSIRIMKAGYHTFLFNPFLCGKITTMTMKGGNTEAVYDIDQTGTVETRGGEKYDNRWKFAKSLADQHPDCVEIAWKWGRWHHHIDYSQWQKIKPELQDGLSFEQKEDTYGLKLVRIKEPDNALEEEYDVEE